MAGLFAAHLGPTEAAPAGSPLTLTPTDDTYVAGELPANNYGAAADVVGDASPVREGYLKFDLGTLLGQGIVSAKLRMWVTNGSGGTFTLKSVGDSSWTEGSLNYGNAPAKGAVITTFTPGTAFSTWTEVDVTSAVASKTGGLFSISMDTSSSDGFNFSSEEAPSNQVHLLVELSGTPAPTATPTPSAAATSSPSPAPGNELTLTPVDDASVSSDLPSNNYGSAVEVISDGSPVRDGYLKFNLQWLAGQTVTSAKLRMWITNGSGGTFSLKSIPDSWSEGSISAGDAPPRGAVITTFSPGGVINNWAEVNLTSAVASKLGTFLSMAIDTPSSDGYNFSSEEAASNRVHLLIQLAGTTGPTPTATASPIGTPTPAATATRTPSPTPTATPPTATPTPAPPAGPESFWLDMVTTGNTYDDTTNTMTVGSIENSSTGAQTSTHTHQVDLIAKNVRDLVGWQVRLNYIGDQMRPLGQNVAPFVDSNSMQSVGFTNLPIDQTTLIHREMLAAAGIPAAPLDGSNTEQTVLLGGTYIGHSDPALSPDTPAKSVPDDNSYSAPNGGVLSRITLQVVGNECDHPLFMDLDDENPNPPGSKIVAFYDSGTHDIPLAESHLHDSTHTEQGCPMPTATPTSCACTPTATPTATATRTPPPTATATPIAGTATPTPPPGSGIAFWGSATTTNTTAANSLTVSRPDGTVAGDVLVASLALNGGWVTGVPSGWTQITAIISIPNPPMYAYYHVAGAGEPAGYTWALSTSVANSGGIARYSGVSNTSPLDTPAVNASSSAGVTSLSVPGVTTTRPGAMLIGAAAINSSVTTIFITGPSGMSERWDLGGKRQEYDDEVQPSAGAGGARTWTFSSGRAAVAWLAALRPAP